MPLGEMMPKPGGGHYVDGIITKDGEELGTLQGTYSARSVRC